MLSIERVFSHLFDDDVEETIFRWNDTEISIQSSLMPQICYFKSSLFLFSEIFFF